MSRAWARIAYRPDLFSASWSEARYALLTKDAPPTDAISTEFDVTVSVLRVGTACPINHVENRVGDQKVASAPVMTESDRVIVTRTQF